MFNFFAPKKFFIIATITGQEIEIKYEQDANQKIDSTKIRAAFRGFLPTETTPSDRPSSLKAFYEELDNTRTAVRRTWVLTLNQPILKAELEELTKAMEGAELAEIKIHIDLEKLDQNKAMIDCIRMLRKEKPFIRIVINDEELSLVSTRELDLKIKILSTSEYINALLLNIINPESLTTLELNHIPENLLKPTTSTSDCLLGPGKLKLKTLTFGFLEPGGIPNPQDRLNQLSKLIPLSRLLDNSDEHLYQRSQARLSGVIETLGQGPSHLVWRFKSITMSPNNIAIELSKNDTTLKIYLKKDRAKLELAPNNPGVSFQDFGLARIRKKISQIDLRQWSELALQDVWREIPKDLCDWILLGSIVFNENTNNWITRENLNLADIIKPFENPTLTTHINLFLTIPILQQLITSGLIKKLSVTGTIKTENNAVNATGNFANFFTQLAEAEENKFTELQYFQATIEVTQPQEIKTLGENLINLPQTINSTHLDLITNAGLAEDIERTIGHYAFFQTIHINGDRMFPKTKASLRKKIAALLSTHSSPDEQEASSPKEQEKFILHKDDLNKFMQGIYKYLADLMSIEEVIKEENLTDARLSSASPHPRP